MKNARPTVVKHACPAHIEVKGVRGDDRVIPFVMTTDTPDRDRDIV